MGTSCSDVCDAVSKAVCAGCPKRETCWLKDPSDVSEFYAQLIDCFTHRKVNVVVGVFQGVASDIEVFSTPEKAQKHKEKLAPDYRNKGDIVTSCVEVDNPTQ